MRFPGLASDLSDAQLEALVLAWMAQELSIAPEGAPLVLRLLGGAAGPSQPISRERTLELTQTPEELLHAYGRLDRAADAWVDAFLLDIVTARDCALALSPLAVTLATGLTEEHIPYLHAYLRARGALITTSTHHWPGYELWHLQPAFVEHYRDALRSAVWAPSAQGDGVRSRLRERVAEISRIASDLAAYCSTHPLPKSRSAALMQLSEAVNAAPEFVLAAERLILAERDELLPPDITARVLG